MTKMKKLIVAILLVVFTMGVASFAACDKPEPKKENKIYYFYSISLESGNYEIGNTFYGVVIKKDYAKCTLKADGTATLIIDKALTTGLLQDEGTLLTYNGTWSEDEDVITGLFPQYVETELVGYKQGDKVTVNLNATDTIVMKK